MFNRIIVLVKDMAAARHKVKKDMVLDTNHVEAILMQ